MAVARERERGDGGGPGSGGEHAGTCTLFRITKCARII
jgi:hypothetical protein